jgi:GNAT superfamily N-acetyltransferase
MSAAEPRPIRDALEADLPAIVAIYNASIPGRMATADVDAVPVETRLDWFRAHTPARRPVWVAERDGQVVGWLSVQSFYGRPAYQATAEVSVYVAPQVQGRGIGRGRCPGARAPDAARLRLRAQHAEPQALRGPGFRAVGPAPARRRARRHRAGPRDRRPADRRAHTVRRA